MIEEHLRDWRPGPLVEHDAMPAGPARALAAVLDLPGPVGEELPPLWHWLYFLDWRPQRELGEDGHPRGGGFLPPIPQRRRMFAGGAVTVHRPLLLGEPAERASRLARVAVKQGGTGELAFVTVIGEVRQGGRPCVTEEQQLVYRSALGERPRAFELSRDEPGPSEAPWQTRPELTSTLLFRFSALTANGHRIHYDEPYARQVEGYPGLVVHGPLLALLMSELARRHRPVTALRYRLLRPVFAGDRVLVAGGADELAVTSAGGHRHAEMTLS
ncbi:FAS1-like dehydratase domain-containing protein [Thermoactinospora rubra]|uniref:FAS1-like dehydratase domain-containing protein n=1 Tax=Thermoactinospora rubra TaxID=1088767 RepID=UPI000A0FE204|nr:MaoC family dehydratase N-terminal domain-containing protein [Thermoactinospora rubra]